MFDRADRAGQVSYTGSMAQAHTDRYPSEVAQFLSGVDIVVASDQFIPEDIKGAGGGYLHDTIWVSNSFSPELGNDMLDHEVGHVLIDKIGPTFAQHWFDLKGTRLMGDVEEDAADEFAKFVARSPDTSWESWFYEPLSAKKLGGSGSVEYLALSRYRRDHCMTCAKPPTIEVKWAEGRAHAWFCDLHYQEWLKEGYEADYEKTCDHGIARNKWSDQSSPKNLSDVYAEYAALIDKPVLTVVEKKQAFLNATLSETEVVLHVPYALGGPGSGHHGHMGRPGKRGGSARRSSTPSVPLFGTGMPVTTVVVAQGANEAYKIEFDDGMIGIYKPFDGQLVGAPENEILASEFSESLGWDLVPKTVQYEYEGRLGSLQEWKPNTVLGLQRDIGLSTRKLEAADRATTFEYARMRAMDSLLMNADRHPENYLYSGDNKKLWAIDNGGLFGHSVWKETYSPSGPNSFELKDSPALRTAWLEIVRWHDSGKSTGYISNVVDTHGGFAGKVLGRVLDDVSSSFGKTDFLEPLSTKEPTYISLSEHTSAMIAFHLPDDVAVALELPGGLSAKEMHVTLVYLGETAKLGGPGSGHHGHAGRPGKRGGSAPQVGLPKGTQVSIYAGPSGGSTGVVVGVSSTESGPLYEVAIGGGKVVSVADWQFEEIGSRPGLAKTTSSEIGDSEQEKLKSEVSGNLVSVSGEEAESIWSEAYPEDVGSPVLWADAKLAYRDGKPVAYISFYDEEAPEGFNARHIEYVKSHAPGAGSELIRDIRDSSDAVWAEAQTGLGQAALEKAGFVDMNWLVGASPVGTAMLYLDPDMPDNKVSLAKDWFEAQGIDPRDVELSEYVPLNTKAQLIEQLELFSGAWAPIKGHINGFGRFMSRDDQDVLYATIDAPDLPSFRQDLVTQLEVRAEVEGSKDHGFIPHITLKYLPQAEATPIDKIEEFDITFDSLFLHWGDEVMEFPLDGMLRMGGPGSGFHGHAGRPGKRGGSASSSRLGKWGVEVRGATADQLDLLDVALQVVPEKAWNHSKLDTVVISPIPDKSDSGTRGTYDRGVMTLYPGWEDRGYEVPRHEFGHSIRHASLVAFVNANKANRRVKSVRDYATQEYFVDTFSAFLHGSRMKSAKWFAKRYGNIQLSESLSTKSQLIEPIPIGLAKVWEDVKDRVQQVEQKVLAMAEQKLFVHLPDKLVEALTARLAEPTQIVVNVPEPTVVVPDVVVNIPEQPIPQVIVNIPEQPAPNVVVNVPEVVVHVPEVVVNVPPHPDVVVTAPNVVVESHIEMPRTETVVVRDPETGRITRTRQRPIE